MSTASLRRRVHRLELGARADESARWIVIVERDEFDTIAARPEVGGEERVVCRIPVGEISCAPPEGGRWRGVARRHREAAE